MPPGSGGEITSDPVDLATGSFTISEIDLSFTSVSVNMAFGRTYRSRDGYDDRAFPANNAGLDPDDVALPLPRGTFARNWHHSFDIEIKRFTSPDIVGNIYALHTGDGKILYFLPRTTTNGFGTHVNRFATGTGLVEDAVGGTVTITWPSGIVFEFHAKPLAAGEGYPSAAIGKIRRTLDRNGNASTFVYDDAGDLERVSDEFGRFFEFRYSTTAWSNLGKRLSSVVDAAGREVVFDYYMTVGSGPLDSQGQIVEVGNPGDLRSVSILSPVPGEPALKWTYKYDEGVYRDETNLREVYRTAAADGPADGQLIVRNTYDTLDTIGESGGVEALVRFDTVATQVRDLVHSVQNEEYDHIRPLILEIPPGSGPNSPPSVLGLPVVLVDRTGSVRLHVYEGRALVYVEEFSGRVVNRAAFRSAVLGATDSNATLSSRWTSLRAAILSGVTAPTRPNEAASVQTRYAYTADSSKLVRAWLPSVDGNVTIVDRKYRASPGPSHGSIEEESWIDGSRTIKTEYRYDAIVAGGCSCTGVSPSSVIIRDVTSGAAVSVTEYGYDANGNKNVVRYGAVDGNYSTSDGLSEEVMTSDSRGRILTYTHAAHADTGSPRTDRYEYFPDTGTDLGAGLHTGSRGRLKRSIINYTTASGADPNTFNLTTTYAYDDYGNVSSIIDPRGAVTEMVYNAHGWLIEQRSKSSAGDVLARSVFVHDRIGNVIREDVDNRDQDGALHPTNLAFTTLRDYDQYGNLLRECREEIAVNVPADQLSTTSPWNLKARSDFVTTEYEYAGNDNLVVIRTGVAASGATPVQPLNVISRQYDERNRLFREIRAPGSPNAVTTQYDYDPRGRLARRIEAAGTVEARTTSYSHDAFDRLVGVVDPMLNQVGYEYDAAGRRVKGWIIGATGADTDGADDAKYLTYETSTYDAMGRVLLSRRYAGFTPSTSVPTQSNALDLITAYSYFPNSAVRTVTQINTFTSGSNFSGDVTTFAYDGAGRVTDVTDAEGNTSQYAYDAGGNLLIETNTDYVSDGTPSPFGSPQVFVVSHTYDALGRHLTQTDGAGNVTKMRYNSRGELVRRTDARGVHDVYSYDGLSRLVRAVRTGCPDDPATPTDESAACVPQEPPLASDIVTQQVWDKSSRLIAQIDDNANATRYWFDELNRKVLERTADGTIHFAGMSASGGVPAWDGVTSPSFPSDWQYGYDRPGNVRLATDANGNQVTSTFDKNGRLVSRSIVTGNGGPSGPPVVGSGSDALGVLRGTNNESYSYDGLSRLLTADDNDTRVVRAYDVASRMVSESASLMTGSWAARTVLSTRTTTYGYDRRGRNTSITYPGGRVVEHVFDPLDRLRDVRSTPLAGGTTALLARYTYVGPGRVKSRAHPSGSGAIGNGTTIEYEYNGLSGTPNSTGDFGFARVRRVLNTSASGTIDDRVVGWDGVQNKVAVSNLLPGWARNYRYDFADRMVESREGTNLLASYTLDGVHNRLSVAGTLVSSGSQIGTYVTSGATPPDDQPVNQYTETPYDLPGYDENGNLVMLRPQGGGGILLDIGLQAAAQNGPMESAIDQRLAQGDTYGDLTNDGLVAGDDLVQLTQMMSEGGFGGGEGGGGFGENSGPIRIADLRYDYRNQMVEYANPDTGNVWRFAYDALGRRVLRTTTYGSTTAYVNGGQSSWQVLAEYDGVGTSANLMATYVYGNYIDEPIEMRRDPDGAGAAAMQSFVFHQDDLFNVVALTAGPGGVTVNGLSGPQAFVAGAVVERVRYGDYGFPTYFDAVGTSEIYSSRAGSPYAFTGREWDADLAYYYYRTRYMDPVWGQFTVRDQIGTWGDPGSTGNARSFAWSNPPSVRDPFGESGWVDRLAKLGGETPEQVYRRISITHHLRTRTWEYGKGTPDSPFHTAAEARAAVRSWAHAKAASVQALVNLREPAPHCSSYECKPIIGQIRETPERRRRKLHDFIRVPEFDIVRDVWIPVGTEVFGFRARQRIYAWRRQYYAEELSSMRADVVVSCVRICRDCLGAWRNVINESHVSDKYFFVKDSYYETRARGFEPIGYGWEGLHPNNESELDGRGRTRVDGPPPSPSVR